MQQQQLCASVCWVILPGSWKCRQLKYHLQTPGAQFVRKVEHWLLQTCKRLQGLKWQPNKWHVGALFIYSQVLSSYQSQRYNQGKGQSSVPPAKTTTKDLSTFIQIFFLTDIFPLRLKRKICPHDLPFYKISLYTFPNTQNKSAQSGGGDKVYIILKLILLN